MACHSGEARNCKYDGLYVLVGNGKGQFRIYWVQEPLPARVTVTMRQVGVVPAAIARSSGTPDMRWNIARVSLKLLLPVRAEKIVQLRDFSGVRISRGA